MTEESYDITISSKLITEILIKIHAHQIALEKSIHTVLCKTDQDKTRFAEIMEFTSSETIASIVRTLYEDHGETPDIDEMLKIK